MQKRNPKVRVIKIEELTLNANQNQQHPNMNMMVTSTGDFVPVTEIRSMVVVGLQFVGRHADFYPFIVPLEMVQTNHGPIKIGDEFYLFAERSMW